MNPDKGKDEKKPGAGGSPGGMGGGGKPPSGGAPGGGKDEGGKPGGASGGKDCDDGKCKELKQAFEKCAKSGGGSGLTKEDAKKWMKSAGLCDEKTGCSEKDFDQAFEKASKGQKSIDFESFNELIKSICKEKKKEPKEFFEKLVSAKPGE